MAALCVMILINPVFPLAVAWDIASMHEHWMGTLARVAYAYLALTIGVVALIRGDARIAAGFLAMLALGVYIVAVFYQHY